MSLSPSYPTNAANTSETRFTHGQIPSLLDGVICQNLPGPWDDLPSHLDGPLDWSQVQISDEQLNRMSIALDEYVKRLPSMPVPTSMPLQHFGSMEHSDMIPFDPFEILPARTDFFEISDASLFGFKGDEGQVFDFINSDVLNEELHGTSPQMLPSEMQSLHRPVPLNSPRDRNTFGNTPVSRRMVVQAIPKRTLSRSDQQFLAPKDDALERT